MTAIHVLYGTESGNAEMAADDIAEVLRGQGFEAEVGELSAVSVAALADLATVVVLTSTYGEGELPENAAAFHTALLEVRPDLSGLRFGAFGLGDSVYDTYNNGIDTLRATLLELGARQVGDTAKHDAASGDPVSDLASAWAGTLLDLIPA
ncbi:flavodoxin domain-containing protein [Nocardia rhamnosiphila]|uniref:Flavodoxin domain-containing protein n=1 Tax=Nocardia rhamnosiphila TaxID=426716 RepID=A0ABV2WRL1_9NOCA